MTDALSFPTPVAPPKPAGAARWRAAVQRLCQYLTLDEREAYLAKATDCADLERRQREWDSPRAIRLPLDTWSW